MTAKVIHAFLDTSVLVHCKPIDQIDWPKELEAEVVVLVLTPTVIGEIDKLKDGKEGRFKRDRARSFNTLFDRFEKDAFATGAFVRERVTLRALLTEPKIAEDSDLDPSVEDDRIIGRMLNYRDAEQWPTCAVVSRDRMLRAKARARGFGAFDPTHLDRPQELDPIEAELKAMKEKVSGFENRLPEIALQLRTYSERGLEVSASLSRNAGLGEAAIERRSRIESQRVSDLPRVQHARQTGAVDSPADVSSYLSAFLRYLQVASTVNAVRGRTFGLGAHIFNEGRGPAHRIQVDLELPEGFEAAFGLDDERFQVPRAPELWNTGRSPHAVESVPVKTVDSRNVSERFILGGRIVRIDVGDVLHGRDRELNGFLVIVPPDFREGVFQVIATVQALEFPVPIQLTLRLRICEGEPSQ